MPDDDKPQGGSPANGPSDSDTGESSTGDSGTAESGKGDSGTGESSTADSGKGESSAADSGKGESSSTGGGGKAGGAFAGKAKLPNAQGIKRPDFTPHGISSGAKGRGPKPSALTAAQAKKRQRVMIGLVLVAVLAIAGGTTWYVTRPGPKLEVTGAFGKEPTVKNLDKVEPTGKVSVKETIPGKGPKLANGDTAFVHLTFYKFPPAGAADSASPETPPAESPSGNGDGKIGSTYQQGQGPAPMNLGSKDLQGIDKTLSGALTGRSGGSRLLVEVPPANGFGKEGNTQLGITGNDTMLFVLDVVAAYPKTSAPAGPQEKFEKDGLPTVEAGKPGEGPKVTMPKEDPPEKLVVETLIPGTGAALAKNDQAVVNYQGQIWKDGKVFDSSWKRGGVTSFSIGTGATVPGFDKGLTGAKIGSRVMLVLPPEEGYGKQGNEQAGIKGTDTLVFIVDVLGKLPK